jgi:hypothetical protein
MTTSVERAIDLIDPYMSADDLAAVIQHCASLLASQVQALEILNTQQTENS